MAKLPKLNYQLPRFGLLASGLLIVTLLTALSGLWHYQHEVAHQSPTASVLGTKTKVVAQNSTAVTGKAAVSGVVTGNNQQSGQSGGSIASRQTAGNYTKPSTASTQNTVSSPSNPSTTSIPQPATVTLTLSINGQSKGSVNLPTGSNHCDLLTQALTDHLISSLDMRYSSQQKTQGVYVIDGIGDPGTIRWTYRVNGIPPQFGCSLVATHNGDSVNWQY